jgi:hypothetical protein
MSSKAPKRVPLNVPWKYRAVFGTPRNDPTLDDPAVTLLSTDDPAGTRRILLTSI